MWISRKKQSYQIRCWARFAIRIKDSFKILQLSLFMGDKTHNNFIKASMYLQKFAWTIKGINYKPVLFSWVFSFGALQTLQVILLAQLMFPHLKIYLIKTFICSHTQQVYLTFDLTASSLWEKPSDKICVQGEKRITTKYCMLPYLLSTMSELHK